MSDPIRLLLAFLFILPATLVAQPGHETTPPSFVQSLERLPKERIVIAPRDYRGSYEIGAATNPPEANQRADQFETLPASNELRRVNTEK